MTCDGGSKMCVNPGRYVASVGTKKGEPVGFGVGRRGKRDGRRGKRDGRGSGGSVVDPAVEGLVEGRRRVAVMLTKSSSSRVSGTWI